MSQADFEETAATEAQDSPTEAQDSPPDAFDETAAVPEQPPAPRPIATQQGSTTTMLKCVVLGSSNVGKSSLLERYTKDSFRPERRVTLGADFASKVIDVGGERVRLVIWDTAGQERFHHGTIGGAFYRGADGALLVYDTTDFSTFSQVELWRRELLQRVDGPEAFPIVCVGNKMDALSTRDQDEKRPSLVRGARCWIVLRRPATARALPCHGAGRARAENKKRRRLRRDQAAVPLIHDATREAGIVELLICAVLGRTDRLVPGVWRPAVESIVETPSNNAALGAPSPPLLMPSATHRRAGCFSRYRAISHWRTLW